jgi:hypothetical protein
LFLNRCGLKQPLQFKEEGVCHGKLYVNSSVIGAEIFVDNQPTGKVTPDTIADIAEGDHVVRIYMDGHRSQPDSLNFRIDKDTLINFEFTLSELQNPGFIKISSYPTSGQIILNGFYAGKETPAVLTVEEGSHSIQVRKAGFSQFLPTEINIMAGDTAYISADLDSKPAVLLESFANSSCLPCTMSTTNLENLLQSVELNTVVLVEYFAFWPNGSDPLYLHNKNGNDSRINHYSVTALPALFVNGAQSNPLDFTTIMNQFDNELNQATGQYSLSISRFENDSLNVRIEIRGPESADLIFFAGVTENAIRFNSAPGANGLSSFNHVFRTFLTNNSGDSVQFIGSIAVREFRIPVHPAWNSRNLKVFAFLVEKSGHQIRAAAQF